MVTITRQWSCLVLAGSALGMLLLAGCASSANGERVSSPSGEEREARLAPAPANTPERGRSVAQRMTMKSVEPSDWSTKRVSEEKRNSEEKAGETGSPSVVF